MSAKGWLQDAATRHQIFLLRQAGSTTRQLRDFVDNLAKEASLMLKVAPTIINQARQKKLIDNLKGLSKDLTKEMMKTQKTQFSALAKYEADFTKRLVDQSSNTGSKPLQFETVTPTAAQLDAAAFTSVMDVTIPSYNAKQTGLTITQALQNFGDAMAGDIVGVVRRGFASGATIKQMRDSILEIGQSQVKAHQANAIARTVTNHISSSARDAFYVANRRLISGYQIVATLDSRTTLTCGALDGKIFPIDNFNAPPYHWHCRTTFIGVVKPKYRITLDSEGRPSKGEGGQVEQVASNTTYNSWLKAQPASFQDEVLGKLKGELLRTGKYDVTSFVDEKYRPIDVDTLKNKDNEHIFNKFNR